jgi:hypothetical protein
VAQEVVAKTLEIIPEDKPVEVEELGFKDLRLQDNIWVVEHHMVPMVLMAVTEETMVVVLVALEQDGIMMPTLDFRADLHQE